jgi:toxin HigB-1
LTLWEYYGIKGLDVKFRFKDKKLEKMFYWEKGKEKYPPGVVDRFFDVMTVINNADDERALASFHSLNFEKYRNHRKGQYSIRLNNQYRLFFYFEEEDLYIKTLIILGIRDEH